MHNHQDIQLKLPQTLGHAPPHDAACHDASDPFGAEERISEQNTVHQIGLSMLHIVAPATMHQFSSGRVNQTLSVLGLSEHAGCPIEAMFGHVS